MKPYIYILILVINSVQLFAQREIINNYHTLPSSNQKLKANLPKNDDLPNKSSEILELANTIPIIDANELFNNSELYKKDANSGDILYRRNQFLGQFKTKAVKANVKFRDAAFVDGDKIRIYLNDKIIKPEVDLESEFMGFTMELRKGINKIDFEALNEGLSAPNTAEFQVFDLDGKLIESSQWNVGTGYKATIILFSE